MIRFIFLIILALFFSNCSNKGKQDIENHKKYAYGTLWSFDMEFLLVHQQTIPTERFIEITYNENNKPIEMRNFVNGKFSNFDWDSENIYYITFQYEKNKIVESYCDRNRNPQDDLFGISKTVTLLNNNGEKVLQTFYDKNGNMVKDRYGNYQYQFEKIENNKRISYSLNKEGKRVGQGDGGFRTLYTLNDRGIVVRNIWQNQEGENVRNKFGYAISEPKYDSLNQFIQISYFDGNNNLCIHNTNNCAYIKFFFDKQGNRVENRYYGVDHELTTDYFCNCSILKYDWENGKILRMNRYNEKEKFLGSSPYR